MIKAINVSPLNVSNELFFRCEHCKKEGNMQLTNKTITTDNGGNPLQTLDYDCPECGAKL